MVHIGTQNTHRHDTTEKRIIIVRNYGFSFMRNTEFLIENNSRGLAYLTNKNISVLIHRSLFQSVFPPPPPLGFQPRSFQAQPFQTSGIASDQCNFCGIRGHWKATCTRYLSHLQRQGQRSYGPIKFGAATAGETGASSNLTTAATSYTK